MSDPITMILDYARCEEAILSDLQARGLPVDGVKMVVKRHRKAPDAVEAVVTVGKALPPRTLVAPG